MTTPLGQLLASTLGLASLWTLSSGLSTLARPSGGIPVLLPHLCSQQELLHLGDSRDVYVRYNRDHSSLVNNQLMPVENDLRREVSSIMATRWEQVIMFSADDSLAFGEVASVLSDLKKDNPELWIELPTDRLIAPAEGKPRFQPVCIFVGSRN